MISLTETYHKILRHKWRRIDPSRKLKHFECMKCKAEKWYDMEREQTTYMDRFGKTHYRAPDCVLPNTKL